MSDTEDCSRTVSLNVETLLKYGRTLGHIAPIAVLYVISQALVRMQDVDPQHTVWFVVAGVLMTTLWVAMDVLANKRDFAVFLDIHNNIEPIDRVTQARMYEGLQDTKFLEEDGLFTDDLSKVMCSTVNSMAFRAISPSVYQNHHCRELVGIIPGGEPLPAFESPGEVFIARKKRMVYRMFEVADSRYQQFAASHLVHPQTFETLVDSFVCRWIKNEVIPALRTACEQKIVFYRSLCSRPGISREFKRRVHEWITKNKDYLDALSALYLQSDIALRSSTVHIRDHGE